ncbi:MAG: hypothetical protein ACI825_000107 [Planctomycetota bacterium]|jgi:hypothetical protein
MKYPKTIINQIEVTREGIVSSYLSNKTFG